MKTINKITELIPDDMNSNRGTERGTRLLEDSLRELGAGRSILIDKHGRVISGNKTLQGAVDIGLDDLIVVPTDGTKLVAVQRTDLDLQKDRLARRLAMADNRIGELNLDWDAGILAELKAEDAKLLDGLFREDELAELLKGLDKSIAEDPGAQIDRADELREKWQTASGQLWEIPSLTVPGRCHRLLCGDSTKAEDVARLMGGEKAALVITDPPYGVEYAEKNRFLNAIAPGNRIQTPIENDHGDKEDIQAVWKAAFYEMNQVMQPGAAVYCFMPQGGDQMMMMMMMMAAGIEPRHELIWLKNNHVLGRVDYAYKHEPILYAWKQGGHKFYGDFQTSILEFPKPQKSDMHPTTKPVELIERLISNSSRAGEVVYDCFLGSGTILCACEAQGRAGRGMELSAAYVAVTLERLAGMGLVPRLVSDASDHQPQEEQPERTVALQEAI